MEYILSKHAEDVLQERSIPLKYVEEVLDDPKLIIDDKTDPELEHRLCRIKTYDNRVLRVIINKTVAPVIIITVYFDRNMRGKI